MEGRRFVNRTLTLAGVAQSIDFFTTYGYRPAGLGIKNDHATNVYTVTIEGALGDPVTLRGGEYLKFAGEFPKLTINGTGDVRVFGCEDPDDLPQFEKNTASAGTGLSADGVTIADTASVLSVKDAGLTDGKINKGFLADVGIPDGGFFGLAAGLPAINDTVRVLLAGGTDQTYTFKAVAGTPNEVTIGATEADTLDNLAAKIAALQADVHPSRVGVFLDVSVKDGTLYRAGADLTLSKVSANCTAVNYNRNQPSIKTGAFPFTRTVTADDVTRGSITFYTGALSTRAAILGVVDGASATKPCTATITSGGNNVRVLNGGANPYVAGDLITLLVLGQVS